MTETVDPSAPTRSGQAGDLLRRWWPGWRDAICLVLLVMVTAHLVLNDGGRPLRPMLPVLALCVLAIVATLPTLKLTPRWLQLLALAWAAGPLVTLVFADVRAGWVRPVAAWAIAVPVALVTLHLLRRRWGATAVIGIAGVALWLSWYEGLLIWLGGGSAQGAPAWLAVSWHSQSGTLMGVLGVGGLGLALTRLGWPRVVGVIGAALGLSATWLSGSRGAALATGVAILVVLAVAARRTPARSVALIPGIALAAAAAVVFTLIPLWGALGGPGGEVDAPRGLAAHPLLAGERDLAEDLDERLGHWQAAARMFASSPVTGTGPGSFGWSSRPHYADEARPANSPHSEQLGALGELGLLGGGAALALTFGLAWLVVGALRRPSDHYLEVAASGVVTLLTGHAAVDFDWDYPLLLALLAVAAVTLAVSRGLLGTWSQVKHRRSGGSNADPGDDQERHRAGILTWVAAVLALALVVAGGTGITLVIRGSTPWALDGRIVAAVTSAVNGDRSTTQTHLDEANTWNPGAPRLSQVHVLVDHALGDRSDEQLVEVIDPTRWAFTEQLQAARQLLDADRPHLALQVVEEVRPSLDQRRTWGVRDHVGQATVLTLSAHHQMHGCTAVEEVWEDLAEWLRDHGLQPERVPVDDTPWADCELANEAGAAT